MSQARQVLPLIFVCACSPASETDSGDETGTNAEVGSETGEDTTDETGETGETGDEPTIEVIVSGDGRVLAHPPGLFCTQTCSYAVPAGIVTLEAHANMGSRFVGWSGECTGTNGGTSIKVSGSHSCTANFEALPEGELRGRIVASREVIRVPAADAPASDSESLLQIVDYGPAELHGVTWKVFAADDGSEVASADSFQYTFSCPPGRRDYDVRATITDGQEQTSLFERRLLTCVPPRSDAGRTVHNLDISQGAYLQNGEVNGVAVEPGDLIRISGNATSNFAFFNFQGEPDAPIHIINDGLVSNTGASWLMHFINCQHVIVDGLGDDAYEHGISLSNQGDGGQAIFVRNYTQGSNLSAGSTDIEMFGVEIDGAPDSGFRIWNGGSAEFNGDNWSFANLRLHHNRVNEVGTEGFYVGYYTDTTELDWPSYPIIDAKIYRNEVSNSGWDGMQFGSCAAGLEVHHNLVTGSALADAVNQRSSLQYNPGNAGAVYNNVFIDGRGVDLQVGCTGGDTLIYANVFANESGGFYIHGGQSQAPTYRVFANTVSTPDAVGMRVNVNSAPVCGPGMPFAALHYASNLLLGPETEVFEVAAGSPDTSEWTLAPNLAWTGDLAALCINDLSLAPGCANSPALAGDGPELEALGVSAAALPGGHFVDLAGRVRSKPANYGAHQGPG